MHNARPPLRLPTDTVPGEALGSATAGLGAVDGVPDPAVGAPDVGARAGWVVLFSGALLALAACTEYQVQKNDEPDPPPAPDETGDSAPAGETGDSTGGGEDTSPPGDGDYCADAPAPSALTAATEPTCTDVRVPRTPSYTPTELWSWNSATTFADYDHLMAAPVVGPLYDTTGDGVIDGDDTPVVVCAPAAGYGYGGIGALTILDGADGRELVALTEVEGGGDTWPIKADGGVALGDIDADGSPDLCLPYGYGDGILCLENDGSFKWAAPVDATDYAAPVFADLDHDGAPEVVFGGIVFSGDGTVLATLTSASAWPGTTVVAQMDADADLEIVSNGGVYDRDGALLWSTERGDVAVVDVDLDGAAELAVVSEGWLYLYDDDGTRLWSSAFDTRSGGAPVAGDLDGDGLPEIGVGSMYAYTVFEPDGSVRWSVAMPRDSSGGVASSAFDFDGDGALEILYGTEVSLMILDGRTGATLYENEDHQNGTLAEHPVIADINGDGAADIIDPNNNNQDASQWSGIHVLSDPNWMPTHRVWNQYAYSITNIDSDLSIPIEQADNWDTYNSFRAAGSPSQASADLRIEPAFCFGECAAPQVEVFVPIANDGAEDAAGGTVTFVNDRGDSRTIRVAAMASGTGAVLGPFVFTELDWGGSLTVAVALDGGGDCTPEGDTVELGPWPYPPIDVDGDGFDAVECGGEDCDDTEAAVHPGATEVDNGLDDDCDGLVDE